MKECYKIWCLLLLFLPNLSTGEQNSSEIEKNLSDEYLELEDSPEDSFEILEDFVTIRSIPSVGRKKIYKKPLTVEPDAEMLPINYKRIQPPGVDHMEMIFTHPNKIRSPKYTKILEDSKSDEDVSIQK
ncbi:uncharacterized protein LOC122502642 [Leptopilina heterotoma]|uniref:uncharacterized protein LOC122502642 n=1 Tax=Leptopilina heterotoma TaxID=63436 RepID=UPI001CA94230|nr:uncharacterized protein LOC122502642 [Leptopilina heterotoma]